MALPSDKAIISIVVDRKIKDLLESVAFDRGISLSRVAGQFLVTGWLKISRFSSR